MINLITLFLVTGVEIFIDGQKVNVPNCDSCKVLRANIAPGRIEHFSELIHANSFEPNASRESVRDDVITSEPRGSQTAAYLSEGDL